MRMPPKGIPIPEYPREAACIAGDPARYIALLVCNGSVVLDWDTGDTSPYIAPGVVAKPLLRLLDDPKAKAFEDVPPKKFGVPKAPVVLLDPKAAGAEEPNRLLKPVFVAKPYPDAALVVAEEGILRPALPTPTSPGTGGGVSERLRAPPSPIVFPANVL
jgi:hypothetical protein